MLLYGATILREKEGEEKAYFIHFGFLPVRLPECPDRPLWLVMIKGFEEAIDDSN